MRQSRHRAIVDYVDRNPDADDEEVAAAVGCSVDAVRAVLGHSERDDDERPRWDDPERCPFCGTLLQGGGAPFVDHVAVRPACEEQFETWRERVRDDIGGEWPA